MKKIFIGTLSIFLIVTLASCAQEEIVSGPEEFFEISELRAAFEEAGGSCPLWEQKDNVTDALQSGTCDGETVLMLFSSSEKAQNRAFELSETMKRFGLEPHLLVGPNWVVNSPQVVLVEPIMMGKLIVD